MRQYKIPAVFVRGGTSKGLMVRQSHLPADRTKWDPLFLAGLGSPDPYGRQLDGMGGGLSSLSKVCVIGEPTRADADVDYTFGQVLIKQAMVDWTPLCGNMSAAVGPYAVDEGLVTTSGDTALVRIHNTNTKKIIAAHFAMEDGTAAVEGDLVIPGIAGSGAPVRLDFLDPGGATTGKLLPTGNVVDTLEVPGHGSFEVSMIDASNACVFVRAADLGLAGTEMPAEIEGNAKLMALLAAIRLAASVRMGIAADARAAANKTAVPFIGFVAPGVKAVTLAGDVIDPGGVDLVARVISNGQPHRALPLGVSMCIGVASKIAGSIVHAVTNPHAGPDTLRISMPSGVLHVTAEVRQQDGMWHALRGGFYRTQRRLFEGNLLVRASALQ
jgi:2-methylaconitate isomerase